MSTTTTTTTQIRKPKSPASVSPVLQDYELCHSGSADAPSPIPVARTVDNNPPGWDTSHRRVPPYRPINRNRDPAETNVYQNGVERAFITTMFAGLFVNAVRPTCRASTTFQRTDNDDRQQRRSGGQRSSHWVLTGCLDMRLEGRFADLLIAA
jgi:hypothetical protein